MNYFTIKKLMFQQMDNQKQQLPTNCIVDLNIYHNKYQLWSFYES